MSADRRQARVLAMQTLCQWDVQPEDAPPIPDDLAAFNEPGEGPLPETKAQALDVPVLSEAELLELLDVSE